MKIEDYKKYGSERFLDIEQISSNKGDGTLENPILIETTSSLPKHLQIRESDLYIQIKDCVLNSLILKKCQNITISKCEFHDLKLEKSSTIEISDSKFNNALGLIKSQHIRIQDCNIKKLSLTLSHNNSISNCRIEDATNDFSRANTFKDLKFAEKSEKYLKELLKSTFSKKIHYLVFLSTITVTIYGTMRLWEFGLGHALGFLSIMSLGILIVLIGYLSSYLSMRKYEPNKLL